MLKKVRITLSIVFFTLITFYFVDFAGWLPNSFHVLEHFQFIPSLMAVAGIITAVLVLLTLLFGRIYCSTLCPMGIFQDIVSWFSKRGKKKRQYRYAYSKGKTILRAAVLGITVLLFLCGFTALVGFIEPYSAYGRIATHLFKPVYIAGNNVLESIFTSFDNYTFYRVNIVILSVFSFIVSIITFLAIGFLAWRYGRTFCNTICPVGTILGFIGKFSFFKIRINTEKCNHCGLCSMSCKASCINSKEQTIDYSRCVDCFNCLGSCNKNALAFTPRRQKATKNTAEEIDTDRRKFFLAGISAAVAAPSLLAQGKEEFLSGGKSYKRQTPIAPPGAVSFEHLQKHCTSCHLCIGKCPSHVLKPAFLEYGIGGIMQPMMSFERGFCNYDCTKCSNICPNGALLPLTKESKHHTQMGKVRFNAEVCVVPTKGTNCGACSEHCPTQAVKMVPYRDGLTIPSINTDICIGCGGCEFICPVRPYRAIFVEGNEVQQVAVVTQSEEKTNLKDDIDFGF